MTLTPRVIQSRAGTKKTQLSVDIPTIDPDCVSLLKKYSRQDLSFEDESQLFNSLVSLIKAQYPFDDALQDNIVYFLTRLEYHLGGSKSRSHYLTYLVPDGKGTSSGFIDSMITLLSSPHTKIVAAALSYSTHIFYGLSPSIRLRFLNNYSLSSFITLIHPHSLPIAAHSALHNDAVHFIEVCLALANPGSYSSSFTSVVEQHNCSELIFHKVLVPSSQYLHYLCQNRHILSGDLLNYFVLLLGRLRLIGPYHIPTLQFVLSPQINLTNHSFLLTVENESVHTNYLAYIRYSLEERGVKYPEMVARSRKQIRQALMAGGFEDRFEQALRSNKVRDRDEWYSFNCISIARFLGLNARIMLTLGTRHE
ncbi:hypothetical protein BLNAU_5867 [Blattamonas nauphoetae]|uniref:Uncharacterized protein n=1 Tax=Blattamonas nauphoetae TaxID=2049346 RepID=A0ABQ9Y5N9_9EUKA|nr:hypothetical protein BLNAU_5867 [Blattamonas nauphoetae]